MLLLERPDKHAHAHRLLDEHHYVKAGRVMRTRPKGRIRTPRLFAAVYSQILSEMEKTGWASPRRRVKLGKARLLRIVIADSLRG